MQSSHILDSSLNVYPCNGFDTHKQTWDTPVRASKLEHLCRVTLRGPADQCNLCDKVTNAFILVTDMPPKPLK